jgi:hypothetical protein
MKHLIYILTFSLVIGVASYFAIGAIAHWYENHVAYGESDLSSAYIWCLVGLLAGFVCGGFIGSLAYKKYGKAST